MEWKELLSCGRLGDFWRAYCWGAWFYWGL